MSTGTRNSLAGTWSSDLRASLVVFLVALPLCMGVAIASGVPVASGLMTGIVGGLVTGVIAGCPLQVSGPAAGLTVIVFDIVQRFGLANLGLIVLLAGIIQIVAGLFQLGQWFRAVSPAVIRGMLAGIGLLILGSQFHVMLDGKPPGNGATNINEIPAAIARAWKPIQLGTAAARQQQAAALRTARTILSDVTLLRQSLLQAAAPSHGEGHSTLPTAKVTRNVDWERLSGQNNAVLASLEALLPLVPDGQLQETVSAAAAMSKEVQAALMQADVESATRSVNALSKSVDSLVSQTHSPNLAGLLGLLSIAIIVLWSTFAPRAWKIVPAAVVAALISAGLVAGMQLPVVLVDLPPSLVASIQTPTLEQLTGAHWGALLPEGLLIAVVASAETLLCAAAVDQMQNGPRTKFDKELISQGFGNTLCGLIGALPMTGVIVRSSANIQAGAKTRLSAILHGVWLLIFVTTLAALLRLIPTSCLAAILVYTGYRLIDVSAIRELKGFGLSEVAIYSVTVSIIVFEDLLTGVLAGMILTAFKLAYTFSHLRIRREQQPGDRKVVLYLDGAATFLRLPKLAATLEDIPAGAELHVDLTDLDYIDHACLDLLRTWRTQHHAAGGTVVIDWDTLNSRFRRDRFLA